MIRFLQLIFLGHSHKWKIIKEGYFYDRADEKKADAKPIGVIYYQQCEHCGKIIRRRLSE